MAGSQETERYLGENPRDTGLFFRGRGMDDADWADTAVTTTYYFGGVTTNRRDLTLDIVQCCVTMYGSLDLQLPTAVPHTSTG